MTGPSSRSPSPLRGLVVDWGGVLTPPLEAATARWARADGVRPEHLRAVMRAWAAPALLAAVEGGGDPSPVVLLERGELSEAEFEHALAAELERHGSSVAAPGLLGRLLEGLGELDPAMVALLRDARAAGLCTALLSNSWGEHYPAALWDGLFDAVVVSGRVGLRKPDERIFRHTAALLRLEPGECVMVDDLAHNVAAAVAVGMVGIRHVDAATTRAELEAVTGLALG